MPHRKPLIRIFESYARADQELVDSLRDRLLSHLRISTLFDFQHWSDRRIDLGDDWLARIRQALASNPDAIAAGLLFLSPAFLGSGFIRGEELPVLLGDYPVLFLVMLERLDPAIHDMQGLEQRQWFTHRGKSYRESRDKPGFALALAQAMHQRLAGGRP